MINGTNGCGGPLRMLVVDDHAAVRAGVQAMMAREPGLQPVGGARTPDHGLAEEILQDTLVAVWKSAQSFEGRSSVRTWLIGIARRQAHNTLRQRRLPLADETEMEGLVATDPEPEAWTLASFARDELAAAFRQLAPLHREVLLLTFVQELSYHETATILEVPVGTVKSRLSNARLNVGPAGSFATADSRVSAHSERERCRFPSLRENVNPVRKIP